MTAPSMIPVGPQVWDRMVRAGEKVRVRLYPATGILHDTGIPYAVIGGNWVARVDDTAFRNTANVDILLRRTDLPMAITAMEAGGFIYRNSAQMDMFLDGPGTKARDAVHVPMANEKVKRPIFSRQPTSRTCNPMPIATSRISISLRSSA